MRPVPGITLATILVAAATSAGFRSAIPAPILTPSPNPALGSALQLAFSASAVEVGGSDVVRAKHSIGVTTSMTQLLDAHGREIAKLVQSRAAGTMTVRGADESSLVLEPGAPADSRDAGFDPENFGLVWRADGGAVAAISLNEGATLDLVASATEAATSSPPAAVAEPGTALDFALLPNRPNPFRDLTSMHFVLPRDGRVEIRLFDVAGREVVRVLDDVRRAGPGSVAYRPRGLAAGLYEMRMTFAPSDGSVPLRAARPVLLLP